MPTLDDSTTTLAPVEEVWKLLYDPSRMSEWWAGIRSVERGGRGGTGDITLFADHDPEFPMPQALHADGDGRRLTISCLANHLVFEWHLEVLDPGTRIAVHVEIPEREAHRLDDQRASVSASLRALATLAAEAAATDGPRERG